MFTNMQIKNSFKSQNFKIYTLLKKIIVVLKVLLSFLFYINDLKL